MEPYRVKLELRVSTTVIVYAESPADAEDLAPDHAPRALPVMDDIEQSGDWQAVPGSAVRVRDTEPRPQ